MCVLAEKQGEVNIVSVKCFAFITAFQQKNTTEGSFGQLQ